LDEKGVKVIKITCRRLGGLDKYAGDCIGFELWVDYDIYMPHSYYWFLALPTYDVFFS